MLLRLVSLGFVGISLLFVGTVAATTVAPSASPAKCTTDKFISGAGIKLRLEPNTTSKTIAILKFNLRVCSFEVNGDWTAVALPTAQSEKGWVQTKMLAVLPTPRNELLSKIIDAQIDENFQEAVVLSERALEDQDAPKDFDEINLVRRLKGYYSRIGAKAKAAEMGAKLEILKAKHVEAGKPQPNAYYQEDMFASWYFSMFSNSSAYHSVQIENKFEPFAIALILEELEGEAKHWAGPEGGKELPERSLVRDYLVPVVGELLYPAVFGDKPIQAMQQFRKRLLDTKLLLRALYRNRSSQYDLDVLSILPASTINSPAVFEVAVFECGRRYGRDIPTKLWKKLTLETVKSKSANAFLCVPETEIVRYLAKFPFLKEREFAIATAAAKREGSALGVLFANLSPELRGDKGVIEAFMKSSADIYAYLLPSDQQNSEYKTYALKTSACKTIMTANPTDRALFERVLISYPSAYRFEPSCVEKLDLSLRNDKTFGAMVVKKFPQTINFLGPKLLADEELLLLSVSGLNSKNEGYCPIEKLAPTLDIGFRRKLIATYRGCLQCLDKKDFLDPAIYRSVTSGPLTFDTLKKLPATFRKDPAIPPLLPDHTDGKDEFEIVRSFIGEKVLLDATRKSGLKGITRLRFWTGEYGEYGEQKYWSPIDIVQEQFWTDLVAVVSKRQETCETWIELLERWATDDSESVAIPSNMSWAVQSINESAGCTIESVRPRF